MIGAKRHFGLSLVEVLIALVVIALVFVALVATQALSLRMTRTSQQSSLATQLAIETVTNRSVKVVANFDQYQVCPGADICSGVVTDGDYSANWSVARGAGYELDGLLLIDVTVSGPATAEMATFVSCMDFEAEDGTTPTLLELGVCEEAGP